MQQFPTAFEFSQEFLSDIVYHTFSARFGTFLGNCEKEREELKLKTMTVSLWSYLNMDLEKYKNILYKMSNCILVPDVSIIRMKLWEDFYMKWSINQSSVIKEMKDVIIEAEIRANESDQKLKEKERELEKLKKKAQELGLSIN